MWVLATRIYHQVFLRDEIILVIPQSPNSITDYAETIREALNKRLQKLPFKPIELAFIKAY